MVKKVAVVEKGRLGGTCLNNGCIPVKTLLHSSGLYRKMREASGEGIRVTDVQLDGAALHKRQKEVIQTLQEGIALQFKKNKIALYQGKAVITEENCVMVTSEADGQTSRLTARHILIAAGSEPAMLPIPGISSPGVENSTSILSGERLYDHLIIIGGGVIGMEFAQFYSDMGKKVTVLEAMDRILPGMDKEISQNLKMILKKRGGCPYKSGGNPSGKNGTGRLAVLL